MQLMKKPAGRNDNNHYCFRNWWKHCYWSQSGSRPVKTPKMMRTTNSRLVATAIPGLWDAGNFLRVGKFERPIFYDSCQVYMSLVVRGVVYKGRTRLTLALLRLWHTTSGAIELSEALHHEGHSFTDMLCEEIASMSSVWLLLCSQCTRILVKLPVCPLFLYNLTW